MTKQNYFSTSFLASLILHSLVVIIAVLLFPDIEMFSKQQYLDQLDISIVVDNSYLNSNKMNLDQKIELEIDKNLLPVLPKIKSIKETINFRNIQPIIKYDNAKLQIDLPKSPNLIRKSDTLKNIKKPEIIRKNITQNNSIPKAPAFQEDPLSQLTLKIKLPNNAIEELIGIESQKKARQCRTVYIPANYHNFKITNGNELIESATKASTQNQSELQLYAYQVLVPNNEIRSIYENGSSSFGTNGKDSFSTWSQTLKNYENKVYYTRK